MALPQPLLRMLGVVRRASSAVRRAIVVVLLAVIYVTVLPWLAVAWRLRAPRPVGWRLRTDRDVASLERLRSIF